MPWALIDANNFFVSCERVFRPDLRNTPVIVLSCNDGCVVSRSQEAKDLGIGMGVPRFQIESLIAAHQVHTFSSNFRLYADLSSRLMRLITVNSPTYPPEIYSIDECFVYLDPKTNLNYQTWGQKLRAQLLQAIGIPVTIGIASTKTLAKLAADLAKKDILSSGVMYWPDQNNAERFFANLPLSQVWGLGRSACQKLTRMQIHTVADFTTLSRATVRHLLSLPGEKTWWELHGQPCIQQTQALTSHRQILRSRSFADAVTSKSDLTCALTSYLQEACTHLRHHHWRARFVTTFIQTSRFAPPAERYFGSHSLSLEQSSNYLPDLAGAVTKALDICFRPHYAYKRAGIILSGLESATAWQPQLLTQETANSPSEKKKQAVMNAVDALNHHFGTYQVTLGDTIADQNHLGYRDECKWHSQAHHRSPAYTSNWQELPTVH